MLSDHDSKKLTTKERSLLRAIGKKDFDTVARLLTEGVNPNAAEWSDYVGNKTALMNAAGCQFPEAVKALLEAGADPKATTVAGQGAGGGYTALHNAIDGSDPTGVEVSPEREMLRRLNIVDLLLRAGASPDAVYDKDSTPIYEAASAGYLDIVKRLWEASRGSKRWPAGSRPPLCGAALGRHASVARFLLDRGHPVDEQDSEGVTPLCAAAYRGAEKVLDMLIQRGANVNHHTKDGRTPLICAALFARDAVTDREHQVALRMVKRLIESKADLDLRDSEGKTALEIASINDTPLVVSYLKGATKRRVTRA